MCLYKLFPLINVNEEGSSVSIRPFFSNIHVIKMHAVISKITLQVKKVYYMEALGEKIETYLN